MSLTIGIGIGGRIGGGGEPLAPTTTMTVSIADSADPVNASTNFTYTTSVTITGAGDAVGVTVTFTLDAQLVYVSSAGTGWSLSRVGQVVTATANALPTGAAPAITITATAPGSNTTVTSSTILTAANATQQTDTENTTIQASIAGVTRDATNLNYYPASTAEWTTFMTAIGLATGNPGNVWALQGTGNAADTGAGGCTLTNTLDLAQQAVAGASRLGYKSADGGSSERLVGTTGAPDPRTTSTLLLHYIDFGALPAASARDIMGVQTGAIIRYAAGSGVLQIVAGATTPSLNDYHNTVGWIAMRVNITASTITLFTQLEKLSGTFVLPNSGSAIWFGGHTALSSAAVHSYGAEFSGAAAEISDAQLKTLLQGLGATIPWS